MALHWAPAGHAKTNSRSLSTPDQRASSSQVLPRVSPPKSQCLERKPAFPTSWFWREFVPVRCANGQQPVSEVQIKALLRCHSANDLRREGKKIHHSLRGMLQAKNMHSVAWTFHTGVPTVVHKSGRSILSIFVIYRTFLGCISILIWLQHPCESGHCWSYVEMSELKSREGLNMDII